MSVVPRFPSPLLRAAGRAVFAAALVVNIIAMTSVAFASVLDNGTDVGQWCYSDNKGFGESEIDLCIKNLCHSHRNGAEAKEGKKKAKKQAKKLDDQDSRPLFQHIT